MNPTWFMVFFMGVTALLTLLTLWHSITVTRSRASRKEIETLQAEDEQIRAALLVHTERLTAVETQLQHMPNNAALQSMTSSIGALSGDFRELLGEFRTIKTQVGHIDEFLRSKK